MYDETSFFGGVVLGFITGMFTLAIFFVKCDNVHPYQYDATKIDLVKKGYAEWVVQENGKVKWKLKTLDTGE